MNQLLLLIFELKGETIFEGCFPVCPRVGEYIKIKSKDEEEIYGIVYSVEHAFTPIRQDITVHLKPWKAIARSNVLWPYWSY